MSLTATTPAKKEQSISATAENQKNIDNHKEAAKQHQEAAKDHLEAAKYHEAGNHDKACESAVKANGHHCLAAEAAKQDAKQHAMHN